MPPSVRAPVNHSFHRLRSFHLSPARGLGTLGAATNLQKEIKQVLPVLRTDETKQGLFTPEPKNLSISPRGSSIVILATLASVFFIISICFAFAGADADAPYFQNALNYIAQNEPGIVLIGESVDVDVDEPSITIRWSVLACGEGFILPGSAGILGSDLCGLPVQALHIFVDSAETPTTTYNPSRIPFGKGTGHRRNIENLVKFDSDHVLDVHQARLYPFDAYQLSSTFRALSSANVTIPISRILTVDLTSSFNIYTTDVESFTTARNAAIRFTSRDIDMHVSRPNPARLFALLLFAINWLLAHITVGHVILARRRAGIKPLIFHLLSSSSILIAIPQIRKSMPDAPGLDGVLIDCIGFFPQMITVGTCITVLLLILAVREFDALRQGEQHQVQRPCQIHNSPQTCNIPNQGRSRYPPPMRNADSSSVDLAQWEMERMRKHLRGQYVFPPIPANQYAQQPDHSMTAHRRMNTTSKVVQEREMSRWYDHED